MPQREASYTFGQFVAGWIIGKLGGEAKVGVMLASTEVQLARRDGFVDALKAVPGAEVVATGDGRNILERATAEAEDMLTANPDINVIYATGDPQLQGGLAAAAAQGREIAFFGWDDIPEPFLKPLEDGRIVGFLKQKPEVGGETAVRLLSDHLEGKEIPKRFTYSPDVVTKVQSRPVQVSRPRRAHWVCAHRSEGDCERGAIDPGGERGCRARPGRPPAARPVRRPLRPVPGARAVDRRHDDRVRALP